MPEQDRLPVYQAGECEIDLARRELRARGVPVPIGQRAFEIIEVLVRSAGDLVTKDDLMDRVWPGTIVGDNTLQVHISAVRKALGPYRAILKTESGRGYRLLEIWTVRIRIRLLHWPFRYQYGRAADQRQPIFQRSSRASLAAPPQHGDCATSFPPGAW